MYCLSMFQLTLQEIYILVMLEMQQLVMLLANILTAAGYNVTREYYINDAGNQIIT